MCKIISVADQRLLLIVLQCENTFAFMKTVKFFSIFGIQELAKKMNSLVTICSALMQPGHAMVRQTVGMDLMKPMHSVVSIYVTSCLWQLPKIYILQLIRHARKMNFVVLITGAFQNTGYVMEWRIVMMPLMRRAVVCIVSIKCLPS